MSIDKNATGWYSYISIIGGIFAFCKANTKIILEERGEIGL